MIMCGGINWIHCQGGLLLFMNKLVYRLGDCHVEYEALCKARVG